MNQTAHSMSPGDLADALNHSFVEGVRWPIDPASLAALSDMGLSPQQIAYYFAVTPAEVVALLNSADAAGTTPLVERWRR